MAHLLTKSGPPRGKGLGRAASLGGLIVGSSGCGKSTILRSLFGEPATLEWGGASVIEEFARSLAMKEIANMCQAVGFNTIPAWLRPYIQQSFMSGKGLLAKRALSQTA